MNKYHSILKNERPVILILTIYLIIGILLLNYFQYIINSDGISYISIAQKYLNGNFADAINGYWGPLFSWLLTPFLIKVSNPQSAVYSMKILSLIIGFFTIIGFKLLSTRFKMNELIRTALLASLIPITLYFSLEFTTPDLLVTCILVYYFYIIFDPNYSNRLFNSFLCGLIGALAYLSKSYALPFFLAHFVLFNLIYYFKSFTKEEKRKITKNLLLGLTIFFIISGAWITLISDKYEKITIGTTGEYNQALIGPQSQGHPMDYQGLIKPPTKTAISAWEDLSYSKIRSWSPFESWSNLKYQMELIIENIFYIFNIIELFSILSILIIIFSILFIIKSPTKLKSKQILSYSIITMFIYSIGYISIFPESRYLWIDYIFLMFMGGYLLNMLFQSYKFSEIIKSIVLIFFISSFILIPITHLTNDINKGQDQYSLSQKLKNDFNINGNIASNEGFSKGVESLYIAYQLNCKYYGITKKNTRVIDLKNELNSNDINYYFVWGNSNMPYKEVTEGKIEGLKVYKINN